MSDSNTRTAVEQIPIELRDRPQWVLWRYDDGRKVPYQVNGYRAKANDSETWTTFENAATHIDGYEGVGFEFSADDSFCGIDLDGCRNADTGEISEWATFWITRFNSYTEVSPSGTGVKIWTVAVKSPECGCKHDLPETYAARVSDKQPAVEIYDRARYFAATGCRVNTVSPNVEDRQEIVDIFAARFWPQRDWERTPQPEYTSNGDDDDHDRLLSHARHYVAKIDPAIQGKGGDLATFNVAAILRVGFDLHCDGARQIFSDFNQRCEPPWDDKSLCRKFDEGNKSTRPRGYLRDPNGYAKQDRTPASSEPSAPNTPEDDADEDDEVLEPFRLESLTPAEMVATDWKQTYLVDGMIIEGEPCIMAGSKKVLKTSLLCDLGVSLATALPFLNKFAVPECRSVGFISGESGGRTLTETLVRCSRSKGIEFQDVPNFVLSRTMPQIDAKPHMKELRRWLEEHGVDVLLLDPTYLCMSGDDSGNLFSQGDKLRRIGEVCNRTDTTLIMAHHNKKHTGRETNDVPELEDIAWAGFQEFARQWLLLGRRERYEPGTGSHRLWLNYGGSAGHSGLWGLDIEEGTDHHNRTWEVDFTTASEARQEASREKERGKIEKAEHRDVECRRRLYDVLAIGPDTKKQLRDMTGINDKEFATAVLCLIKDRLVETCKVTKGNNREYDGFRRIVATGTATGIGDSLCESHGGGRGTL